jgi:acetylglutamate kinase
MHNKKPQAMKKPQLFIIKIGGNILDDEMKLQKTLEDLSLIEGKKILVHGGGKILDRLAKQLNIPQEMINGRRITNEETLDLATMVYAGLLNKKIVARLQSLGANALGLTGADGNSIKAEKRTGTEINFGFVGDVKQVNTEIISALLEKEIVPVFCSLTHDGSGKLLNTNADTLASSLAIAFSEEYNVSLNFCFEKNGVLQDPQDENSVIPEISREAYQKLLEKKIISSGMIPKLDNAFAALGKGVKKINIGDAGKLLKAIQKNENAGTCLIGN